MLPLAQRREAMRLFMLMLLVALLETLGVGTILPFVAVASNPAALHGEGALATVYKWSGAVSENHFLLLLGIVALFIVVVGNALRTLSTWQTHWFSQNAGHVLAVHLFRAYLARPYEYFLTRHSADLGKNILHEVHQVVNSVVFPAMSALSRAITAVLLVALLFVADPVLTMATIASLGGAYLITYKLTRSLHVRLGERHIVANHGRYYVASEVFSGVKEIKLKGLETVSVDRYVTPSLAYARGIALTMTLSQAPRFLLEAIAFGGVLAILLYLLLVRGGIAEALPLVSLYAFAGYRLLPALQEIFASATRIRFALPSLEIVYQELANALAHSPLKPKATPLPFAKTIRLEGVSYRYPRSDRTVVKDATLEIPHGARVAFVGPTGAGKSTTVDLILGLLRPVEGRILIDGTPLEDEETIRRWQAQVGYVPQHIFLADDTIACNVAFGQRGEEIDRKAVEQAARMAQLHDFIVNELPEAYDTPIGERGIRLSGGQRQRLGLARALYGKPAVLVLDEATSALDNETESMVMTALESIGRDVTIIVIAHRLSSIRRSDIVFQLKDGRVAVSAPMVGTA